MKLFTHFKTTEKPSLTLSHKDKVVLLGSCFSENMKKHFELAGFHCNSNPFGVIYNPISIAHLLQLVASNQSLPKKSILNQFPEISSLLTHSLFRESNEKELQKAFTLQSERLNQSPKTFIISLGTAWVYTHLETGYQVANCHKIEARAFRKQLLSQKEVNESLSHVYNAIITMNPKNKVIFTLSPVRHLKDGFIENQMSKALLHLGIQNLLQKHEASYFPAYEIVMDELRDYRFYKEDLVHPNAQAVKHIWSIFSSFYFAETTQQINKKVEAYHQLKNHHLLSKHLEKIKTHEEKVQKLKQNLESKYPQISLS